MIFRKAETEQKELKLLLDMYKSVNRDKREKMQLAVVEKKLKNEIEETKAQMRRILVKNNQYLIIQPKILVKFYSHNYFHYNSKFVIRYCRVIEKKNAIFKYERF